MAATGLHLVLGQCTFKRTDLRWALCIHRGTSAIGSLTVCNSYFHSNSPGAIFLDDKTELVESVNKYGLDNGDCNGIHIDQGSAELNCTLFDADQCYSHIAAPYNANPWIEANQPTSVPTTKSYRAIPIEPTTTIPISRARSLMLSWWCGFFQVCMICWSFGAACFRYDIV